MIIVSCHIIIIFSAGLRCYECIGCNDVFNASEAKTEYCSGTCAKTKRDNCT